MLKILAYLLLSLCFILQSCKHQETESINPAKEVAEHKNKPDLSKAAAFNVELGLGYLREGNRPRAKKKLLLALSQKPNSAEVNSALAYFFEKTQETDQAKKYYLKAISLSSHSGSNLNNYGAFLCRQANYKEAEQYFLKAAKDMHYINTSAAYENAGLCSLAIPDYDKARLYFTTALNQDPTRVQSLSELVKLEVTTGNNKEAIKQLEKYSDLVLNNPDLLNLAKELANKTGDHALIAKYETIYQNLDPNYVTSGVNNDYNNHTA